MRALVIGGSGYLGSTVVRAFAARGIDVTSLSRSGAAVAGAEIRGDVSRHDLGLDPAVARSLRAEVTHIVSCFGSVDWKSGPRLAGELHQRGTLAVMRFAESCAQLQRLVHVSSVLVLGRVSGRVTDELELGQSFRNWYEYGKYLAEREIRADQRLPWRVLRLGPVLGPGLDVPPNIRHGLPAVVPTLLRGYPVHLADKGQFPSCACDAATAGAVVACAALTDGAHDVWTWMDDAMPTLAEVLVALCSAWGVVPRIIDAPLLGALWRAAAGRVGAPLQLLDYVGPWAQISADASHRLPAGLPRCPPGYLEATGEALRQGRPLLALEAR
jgi:nucleoside-diphosphate-sugar epimerase